MIDCSVGCYYCCQNIYGGSSNSGSNSDDNVFYIRKSGFLHLNL